MAKQQSVAIEGLKSRGIDVQDDQNFEIDAVSKGGYFDDEVALEAFMAEPVKVLIQSTTDTNAPPYADLSVNGVKAVVRRNQPTWIKRFHLEVLARMKETKWLQQVPDGYIGAIDQSSLRGHSAPVYPFQVLEDKNPRGGAWLEHIRAEPA